MSRLHATNLLQLAQLGLPWFGHDVNRVLWEVDAGQLCAIAQIELGHPDGGWVSTTRKAAERAAVLAKLKGLKRENPDT